MKIEYKDPAELVPYERNAKVHTEEQVELIKNSIRSFGFKIPILIDEAGEILAGHGRRQAALELGLEKVPVVLVSGLSEDQKKALRLADNKTASLSEWDNNALSLELEGIFDVDMEAFGFNVEPIDIDSFGVDFELPDGEKPDENTISFSLSEDQLELVKYCAEQALAESSKIEETANDEGNGIAEIARQYLAGRVSA